MAGPVRGDDLNSWWLNRATFRQDASKNVAQWQAAAARFSKAAEGARPSSAANVPVDSLVRQGDAVVASLQAARARITALDQEREQAQSGYAATKNAVDAACHRRVQQEREQAGAQAYKSAVQAEKAKTTVRKLASAAIFLAVLYVIVRF
jgi:hypothetical protein